MLPVNDSHTFGSGLKESTGASYTAKSIPKTKRKVSICQYKESIQKPGVEFKVFPFVINGKTYSYIDRENGCDLVSENDDVVLDFYLKPEKKKDAQIIQRISDIMSKEFRNVCTVLDRDRISITEGVCHNFAHYLALGFTVLNSSLYEKYDSFYDSIPSVKIVPFIGEKHLMFGDIV